jgi:hypothetical protein
MDEQPQGSPASGPLPAAERCVTCWSPHALEHAPWCWRGQITVGEALRDARDLEHAIAWQPPRSGLHVALSAPEREQLGLLFDALIARDREGAA